MRGLVAAALGALLMIASPAAARSAGDDRTEILDLYGRYTFALDWQDPDGYAECFTEDGVLDWAQGVEKGREAIRKAVHGMRDYYGKQAAADAPRRPAKLMHFITNPVIKLDGDRATGRAYWFEINNDGRDRWPYVSGYGYSEDEFRFVGGHWLISRRKILNEILAERAAGPVNPAR